MNIKAFCAEEEGRYQIHLPFKVDGKTYATDGRICVRISAEIEGPFAEEGRHPKNVASMFANADKYSAKMAFQFLDTVQLKSELTKCDCVERPICKHCDQEILDGDDVIDPKCRWCHGAGKWNVPENVSLDGRMWGGRYIALIQRECRNPKYRHSGNQADPMYFVFDGGDGILMTMLQPGA